MWKCSGWRRKTTSTEYVVFIVASAQTGTEEWRWLLASWRDLLTQFATTGWNRWKSFRFKEFRKGLEWFANAQCSMCLNGGGAPCKNRKCASEKKLKSCLLCDDYLTCERTQYQREWYPFVVDNYNRVKQVGFQKHPEEEEERARAGVDLMGHLERRCCKVVKLEE